MGTVALKTLAEETGGELIGASVSLSKLALDSRHVGKGDLFAAIKGSQVDGHDYAVEALNAGAAALLTQRKLEGIAPQLVVSNVTSATGRFGFLKRQAFSGDIVAITGSAGKTTTKNLLGAALGPLGAVHATPGNQNNELGVPVTLAGLTDAHRFGVIEMGAGRPGDIAYLCTLAAPDVAVCLNASAAHLENYVDVGAIAKTKGEIFEGLGRQSLAVMNADQEWLPGWRKQAGNSRQVTFGFSPDADYRATAVAHRGVEGVSFHLTGPMGTLPVSLHLAGEQHVANASAALAVAIELGVDPPLAAERLLTVRPSAGRGAVFKRSAGGRVVDDSYNANPTAVRAAVDVLAREPAYRVLILGPMLELGEASARLHAELGAYARQAGIDRLITVGEEASSAAESFGQHASHFADLGALRADFPVLPTDHIVWVKGSRAAGLEHLVSWLLGAREVPLC